MDNLIEIPWDALAEDILNALVEEFVTREGTDYGQQEVALERKVAQVVNGIRRKDYVIVFDTEAESTHILTGQQWREAVRQSGLDT
ncbi:MAG: YheU family protein [Gammaproteobacteria bacterium]|nr:YheU family protein [Gammaproteobacteria bacterium]